MNAIEPINRHEIQLIKKEDWEKAIVIDEYWWDDEIDCDFCHKSISGRHMIDGLVKDTFSEFACMCPSCHKLRGSGFGEGKGQLYSRLTDGRLLLTFGFTGEQLENFEGNEKL